jgi:Rieske Fe-S protein
MDDSSRPSRRDLLCSICLAAAACQTGVPAGPIDDTDTDIDVDTDVVPPTDTDVPWTPCIEPGTAAEGWQELPFDTYPELAALYGHAYLTLSGRPVVIAQVEDNCFVALERPCTHEGVLIEYREERNGFVCPRHGAIYGWDGRVIGGPAPAPLASFPCGRRDDAVWILVT